MLTAPSRKPSIKSELDFYDSVLQKLFPHSVKKGYQNGAPGVLLLQMVPFCQKGTLFSLIMFMKKEHTANRGAVLQNSAPMRRGAFFLTNMIIKEKKHRSEKRVVLVAKAPQGHCFGTLFF